MPIVFVHTTLQNKTVDDSSIQSKAFYDRVEDRGGGVMFDHFFHEKPLQTTVECSDGCSNAPVTDDTASTKI